jgi:uncharacterized membrane protein (UPF0127 family)
MMNAAWRLVERGTGCVVVERLAIAEGFGSRLVGWQFRRRPPRGFGLLLVPCPSIHTCFLRFAIDLLALDRVGRVIDVRHDVRPWRLVLLARSTFAVVEIPSGEEGGKVGIGTMLRLVPPEKSRRCISRTLAAWCGEIEMK